MLLAEPPPTQADLHFRLFGIPVRVHPFFWVVALLLGITGREQADPFVTLLWVAVVFVSILVHEFGHAFTQRHYGGHPWITLHGIGGLASCDDCDRSTSSQIIISLAGPAAGFLFAAVIVGVLIATGHFVGFRLSLIPVVWRPYESMVDIVVLQFLWINILWGVINLLPIYPLDGGRVAREVLTLGHPRQGIIQSLWLSIVTSGAVAVWGLVQFQSIFMAFLFGYLAYSNYQTLQAYQRGF